MIYAEKGKEQECFIDFVEKALGILAQEKYRDFLAVFDNSRIYMEFACVKKKIQPKM